MTDDSSSRIYRRKYESLLYTSDNTDKSKSTSKSPGLSIQNEMSQSVGGKLAQEIQDELLICKICLGNYKQPKSLCCLHTFCAECLENHIQGEVTYKKYSDYREFTCPLCRKRTTLPIGGVRKLPDNFVVSSLFEMIQKRKSSMLDSTDSDNGSGFFCQICHKMGNRKREAQTKCIDCSKLLCRNCTDIHRQTKVTQNHSLFDLKIEDDVICKMHADEPVRFFCKPCQTCICVLCTFNEHSDHEVTQFTEAVIKYKSDIESQLLSCQSIISDYEEKISKINNVKIIIESTEAQISELAAKLIGEIKQKETQLLEEIRNLYGTKMIDMVGLKSTMENQLSELKNTCNMAEVILQRKDIELLLLKKEIQNKLQDAQNLPTTILPATVTKEVKFIPGIFEFGSLQDMDRPMLTKPKCFRAYEDFRNLENSRPEQKNMETQTDPDSTRPSTSSKSISTNAIQFANKAVNTRTRVIQTQKSRANPLQFSNGQANVVEIQPIATSENKIIYVNTDKVILSPTTRRRSANYDKMRNCDTKELILTASEILTEFISNTGLDDEASVVNGD